ncbi:carbohydrate esterase family 14 protein [Mycena metata]|uniref:N-acetylglucosaminylphosphatidylinositol deacetylase n=1 Tax=Mycena metata TaxID=1033252 RepID=A0AAD7KII5_9AGAR|nr:carbohydrate esterase family 14 protein [Mycena metata]
MLVPLLRRRTISTFGFEEPSAGHKERILLLTAHPDDETFFFSPTLTALSHTPILPMHQTRELGDLFIVCLSTGNAKGLGNLRQEEFGQALEILGVREERRFILDHPYLQDNKTGAWDPAVIANEIHPLVRDHGITIILTFDSEGITGHPNHRSTSAGAAHLVFSTLPLLSATTRPRLFTLYSRPATKHLGPVAALISQPYMFFPGPVFVASVADYVTAFQAMTKHPSQLRLFSFVKGLFSRYLWVNEWVEVIV